MSGVLFTISHFYLQSLFREYAQSAQKGSAEQWARLLAYYYQDNGNAWVGVNRYVVGIFTQSTGIRGGDRLEHLTVYDAQNHVVFRIGPPTATHTSYPNQGPDESVPIIVNGKEVGSLAIRDRALEGLYSVEQSILQSMTLATIWGTVVTALVALLLGAWLIKRLTHPLRQMLKAIHRITAGDLQVEIDIQANDEFGQVAHAFNKMTAQLSRTEEARRHLVADVAHELRIPLTIMQGQLELIQQGVKPAEPSTLLPIQDEVMRLTRLVQDLHQLSLAEVGKLPLEKQSVELVGLLQKIVDNFEMEFDDKKIQLIFRPHADANVCVTIDPHRMTQVFVNLLGNALRHTPSGGTITVDIEKESTFIKVFIQDTGTGIPEDHVPYIFDRFYRADEDRSRETGGTGLGLAIAKEFVESHHGRIEVASVPQQGTRFTVLIPVRQPDEV